MPKQRETLGTLPGHDRIKVEKHAENTLQIMSPRRDLNPLTLKEAAHESLRRDESLNPTLRRILKPFVIQVARGMLKKIEENKKKREEDAKRAKELKDRKTPGHQHKLRF